MVMTPYAVVLHYNHGSRFAFSVYNLDRGIISQVNIQIQVYHQHFVINQINNLIYNYFLQRVNIN
jgi:hypothetical protein